MKRSKKIKATGIFDWDTYVVPQTVWSMYNIPTGITVKGNSSQGVIEWEGQNFSPEVC